MQSPSAALERAFQQGLELHQQGRLAEAENAYRQVLQQSPDHAEALHLLGVAAIQTRRTRLAIELIGRAVALKPDHAEAHVNLGIALQQDQRPEAAIASFDRAIALEPDFAEAHYNRGLALQSLHRPGEAVQSYDRAIELAPDYTEAHCNRGAALQELKRPEEAVASYERAIALQPDLAEAHYNRGLALRELKRPEDSLASYDRAIALTPDHADMHINRGIALQELLRPEEALTSYEHAIALNPNSERAYINRGVLLQEMQRPEEAVASYNRAITLAPDHAEANSNKGFCLLQIGQFEEGWRLHEWRRNSAGTPAARPYPQPVWLGEQPIAGKTLFLYWEQGFGDTIQFYRYARLAQARGARVVLEVPHALEALLKPLDRAIQVIRPQQSPGRFDYHCPLSSLPLAFGTTLETIPSATPYIIADATLRAKWSARLKPASRPRIGLVWSGNPEHRNDRNRSVDLATCLKLLSPDADWISLQKDIRPADAATLLQLRQSCHISDFSGQLTDFSQTAALTDLMDLIVTVDTSVAHLAAAMGKPVWLLLPYNSDWRWLLDRDDSPWYPSMRLFRQQQIGHWPVVIGQVKTALRSWLG